jgi:hypothetical protein
MMVLLNEEQSGEQFLRPQIVVEGLVLTLLRLGDRVASAEPSSGILSSITGLFDVFGRCCGRVRIAAGAQWSYCADFSAQSFITLHSLVY